MQKLNKLIKQLPLLLVILLAAACSSDNTGNKTHTVSGSAVKGLISNGIIDVFEVASNGETRFVTNARTTERGTFSLELPAYDSQKLFLLELRADEYSRMICDVAQGCRLPGSSETVDFGESFSLPESFRLLGSLSPKDPSKAYLSPLSHLVLSTAMSIPEGLTPEKVSLIGQWLKQDLRLSSSPLTLPTADLTDLASLESAQPGSVMQALYAASLFELSFDSRWSQYRLALNDIDLEALYRNAMINADFVIQNFDPLVTAQAGIPEINQILSEQLSTITASELVIVSQPQTIQIMEGKSVSLRVSAYANSELSYQWYKGSQSLQSENGTTLNIENVQQTDAGVYSVQVTNGTQTLKSANASINVLTSTAPPSIVQQPQNARLVSGQALRLAVDVRGAGPFSYVWQKGGSILSGENASSLEISHALPSDSGSYYVTISNPNGSVRSAPAEVLVTESLDGVVITSQPRSTTVVAGQTASFEVNASGSGFLTYQWRRESIPLAGQTSKLFTINDVQYQDEASYDVVVSNSQGSVVSASATLNVLADSVPLEITRQPSSASVLEGESAYFSVLATGMPPIRYQWYLNGQAIVGATQSYLAIERSTSNDAGNYYVRVSDSAQSVDSSPAALNVDVLASLVLSWQIPTARENGSPLSVKEISGYALEYSYDGTQFDNRLIIPGATTTTYTLSGLRPGYVYLRIATVDALGVTGRFSGSIQVYVD